MTDQSLNNPLVLTGVSVSGAAGRPGTGADPKAGFPAPRLADVDLTIGPGEWVYVAGTNGSGKTTLARLLAGLSVEPDDGRIDRGFAGWGPSPYVMQHPDGQLFGETPREELVFALEWLGKPAADIPAAAERALRETGLLQLADQPWSRLSGGQRQLAAVAAAAAGEASLLVFDEATSMLDDASRRRVAGLAGRLHASGSAIVWVTQRLGEIAPERRVVALSEGRLVYDGSGREFLLGSAADGGYEGAKEEMSPCERCGLRLPYLAALSAGLRGREALAGNVPLTGEEWRKTVGGTGAGGG